MKFLKSIYYEKYAKKSYAISNVDLIIDRIFANKKKGVYIDVGCNHPIKYNNTYLLYKRGWNGINIDLDKLSIKEFNKFRKKDHNVETIVSSDGKIKEVYFYHARSAINTLSKELINYRKSKTKKIKKESRTLNEIIENSPFNKKKINLISIDVENYEYEVLKNFNFKKYKVDLIVTECLDISQKKLEMYTHSLDFINKTKLYKLLIKNNYKLINWVNSDLVFFNKKTKI